ncbi:MAG: purine-nucleoside phosphorylase [Gemmatimonadales bacterium]
MVATRSEAGDAVHAASEAVARRLGGFRPRGAIVLGSGLGMLADEIESAIRIPQSAIPGFPAVGVAGHKGELVAGTLEGVPVLAQSGRFHLYEGHAPATVALPVRVFADLGVTTLIATNAAGGIRATFRPGTLMLIADHINLMWRSPLAGATLPGEERFPDMSEPYDRALRARAREVASAHRIALEEGVYCGLLGPAYETPAEIRLYQRLGADAVGMSTVPEVIVARARGLRCLGFSTITNVASGLSPKALSHEEVLEVGRRVSVHLGTLIKGVVATL